MRSVSLALPACLAAAGPAPAQTPPDTPRAGVAAPVARGHETSDGRRVTTPRLDLLYFVPKMDLEPARQLR